MTRAEMRQVWGARFEEYRASGLSAKAWCAAHDVKPERLWYWLKKIEGKTHSVELTRWLPLDVS
ncbi:hypothetical protein JCM15765_21470 [Paradesulfitobacterium aromaticivorans]